MKIYLIRHGESYANCGDVVPNVTMPCNKISLTAKGRDQAYYLGQEIEHIIKNCNIYHSPFLRAQQTLYWMLTGAGYDVKSEFKPNIHPLVRINEHSQEDPRLREVDVGTGKFHENIRERAKYGWFYYRFQNGETPCEVYDRCCSFYSDAMVESLSAGKDMMIISHGMTIRALVMRALRLTVENFNSIDNPSNCRLITVSEKDNLNNPVFVNRGLGVEGITLREDRNDYTGLVEM